MNDQADDLKERFVQEIKLRGYDDQYIDRKEEVEILQIAVKKGISVEAGRAKLAEVCEANGYVLESRALAQVAEALSTFAENDGQVDKKEYQDAVTICQKATKAKKTERECRRLVLSIMEVHGYKPKTGWFSNWYKAERDQVGLT